MSFPGDYKRVQQAGGIEANLLPIPGLPRQILINTTDWSIHLMDGVTPGGFKVLMLKDLAANLQANGPLGILDYIVNADEDADPGTPESYRLWKGSTIRAAFEKIVDVTVPASWKMLDSALPRDQIKAAASQTADLNAATAQGWYQFIPNATLNLPGDLPSGGTDRYMMMVIRQSNSELTQIIFSRAADGKIWIRSVVAGVWQAWLLATGVTSADLALKVAKAGDTMSGKLILPASAAGFASLNILSGAVPTVPVDGDIWRRDADGGLRLRKGGTTRSILDSEAIATVSQIIAGTAGKIIDAAGRAGLRYTSPTTVVAAGSEYTFAHGLGATPARVWVNAIIKVAFGPYLVGDRVNVTPVDYSGVANTAGSMPRWDATNVKVIIGNQGPGYALGTGGSIQSSAITAAQANIEVVAEL